MNTTCEICGCEDAFSAVTGEGVCAACMLRYAVPSRNLPELRTAAIEYGKAAVAARAAELAATEPKPDRGSLPTKVETRDGVQYIKIEPGNRVLCDDCGEEYTDRPDVGGILFGSKAYCPKCAPDCEAGAKRYGETQFIRARCPEGMAFADWVRNHLR